MKKPGIFVGLLRRLGVVSEKLLAMPSVSQEGGSDCGLPSHKRSQRVVNTNLGLPILVGISIATGTLFLWQALIARDRSNIDQAIDLEAANAKYEIIRQLQDRTLALERMARRWETQGKPTQQQWEADAALLVQHYGGYQAISWVDPSLRLRWLVSRSGNEVPQNLNLTLEERRRLALEAARNQRKVVATQSLKLVQGGEGFLVVVPIFEQQQFGGVIVAAFETQKFLETLFNDLDKRVGRRYAIAIFEGNEKIYSHYTSNGLIAQKWGKETTLDWKGINWRLQVWPESALLHEKQSALPILTLGAGLAIAALLYWALYLMQVTRIRNKIIEAFNKELEQEISDRKLIEIQLKETTTLQRAILDSANYSIISCNTDGTIRTFNQGGERLLGYAAEEVVGKTTPAIFHDKELVTQRAKELSEELGVTIKPGFDVFTAKTRRGGWYENEWVYIRKDGSRFPVQLSVTALRDAEGNITGFLGIGRDISDAKRAKQRLQAQYLVTRFLSESQTLQEVAPKILQAICDSLAWDIGELWVVDAPANALRFFKSWSQPSVSGGEFEPVSCQISFTPGIGLPGRVWASGEPAWISDILHDDNFLRPAIAAKIGLHAAFGLPILGSNEVVGILTFFSREIRETDQDLLDMVTAIGRQIGQFIERQIAQSIVEQQREWLEVTLSSIGDGAIATDTTGKITFINPVAEVLTGWLAEEALGQKIEEVFCIIHQQTRQPVEVPVERVLREIIVLELPANTILLARDGREIPIEDSVAPILSKSGKLQGAILIFRNMYERKRAELALRRSTEELQAIYEGMADGILITDVQTQRFLRANTSICKMLGYSETQLLSRSLENIHPADQFSYILAQLIALLEQKIEYAQEIPCVRENGTIFFADISARQIIYKGHLAIICLFRDITERKQAQENIRKALEKEKELNELKSRFVSMASHEFRTPLSTILLSAGLLEDYGKKWSDEKKQTHLTRIQTAVKRMTSLLDDVLIIGKADAGKIEFNPGSIELEKFCRELVEEFQLNASNQHTITFILLSNCTDTQLDEKLLRHILSNLLSNAIKYSPQGGEVRLKLTCQPSGNVLASHPGQMTTNKVAIFRIEDEGIGIPPEDQKHLFETFQRATNVGTISGTGLGLAIVKRSVDLHGGQISCQSEVGVGTTFTVTLPVGRSSELLVIGH